jgi:hypothetical protein
VKVDRFGAHDLSSTNRSRLNLWPITNELSAVINVWRATNYSDEDGARPHGLSKKRSLRFDFCGAQGAKFRL